MTPGWETRSHKLHAIAKKIRGKLSIFQEGQFEGPKQARILEAEKKKPYERC